MYLRGGHMFLAGLLVYLIHALCQGHTTINLKQFRHAICKEGEKDEHLSHQKY